MRAAHAKLSASGAHRWIACPRSVALEDGLPDTVSSYAAEGTSAHELAEQCLRGGVNADTYLGDRVAGFTVDREMVEAVQVYLDYVRDQDGELFIEQRVGFEPWVPGGFGTADAVVLGRECITVIDLKYGRGVRVDAPENPQIEIYGLGALEEFGFLGDFDKLKLVIVQPRLDHISEWIVSRDELIAWADDELALAADLALVEDAPCLPGESQCRFCKAKGICRALANHSLDIATEGFTAVGTLLGSKGPMTLKETGVLSEVDFAYLIPHLDLLVNWAKAVEAEALHRLEAGAEIEGYKLVEGRSIRRWMSDEDAETALRKKLKVAEIFTKKLISPAQAEKLLGKGSELVAALSEKPAGKPAIAPGSDKRPALEINPADGFEQVA